MLLNYLVSFYALTLARKHQPRVRPDWTGELGITRAMEVVGCETRGGRDEAEEA